MSKMPRPSGKEMVQFLLKQGFSLKRIRGSHHFLERENVHTTIPVHGNDDLRIGTLHGILRDMKLSPADFERLWKE